MHYSVTNRLENGRDSGEEPNTCYELLQIAVVLLLYFLENRRM